MKAGNITFKKILLQIGKYLMCLLITLSFLAFFSAIWYRTVYGDLGFESILYTLTVNTDGAESNLAYTWALFSIPMTAIFSAAVITLLLIRKKKERFLPLPKGRKLKIFPLQRVSASVVGAAVSVTVNKMLAIFIVNIDVLLSIGGFVGGLCEMLFDKKFPPLDGKIVI